MRGSGGGERLRAALDRLNDRPMPTQDCPAGEVLLAAVRAELHPEALRLVGSHAVECDPCADGWRMAKEIARGALPPVPIPGTIAAGPVGAVTPSSSFGRWGFGLSAVAMAAVATVMMIPAPPEGGTVPAVVPAPGDPIMSLLAADVPVPRGRCILRWSGPAGARYRLSVVTRDMRPLITSQEILTSEYRIPPRLLAGLGEGEIIVWQVTAIHSDGTSTVSPQFTLPVN